MLFLLFQLGPDRYALEARHVIEVLPLVHLKKIPQAPAGVAGIFNYRGAPVPVIDLSELNLGRPSQARLNTRIILVNYGENGRATRPLGLIAERATETIKKERSEFAHAGVDVAAAPYLGPVAADARGLIQLIEIRELLPESVRNVLFRQSAEQG